MTQTNCLLVKKEDLLHGVKGKKTTHYLSFGSIHSDMHTAANPLHYDTLTTIASPYAH